MVVRTESGEMAVKFYAFEQEQDPKLVHHVT